MESTEGHKEEEEGCSDNISNQRNTKRQKIELQGEFNKIKSLLFEGDFEEVVEAWMIDMGKYF